MFPGPEQMTFEASRGDLESQGFVQKHGFRFHHALQVDTADIPLAGGGVAKDCPVLYGKPGTRESIIVIYDSFFDQVRRIGASDIVPITEDTSAEKEASFKAQVRVIQLLPRALYTDGSGKARAHHETDGLRQGSDDVDIGDLN